MMTRLFISLWLAAAIAPVVGTPVVEAQDRFAVFSNYSPSAPTYIYQVGDDGKLISTIASLPISTIPQGATVGAYNRSVVMTEFHFQLPAFVGSLLSVAMDGKVTTIYAGAPLERPVHAARDSDGDWIVFDAGPLGSRNTKLVRITAGKATTQAVASCSTYAVVREPESGQFVIRGAIGVRQGLYRIDPKTGAVTRFWEVPSNEAGYELVIGTKPIFEAATGAVLGLWSTKYGLVFTRFHPEIGRFYISPQPFLTAMVDMTRADQEAAAAYYVLGQDYAFPPNFDIVHLRRNGVELKRSRVAAPSVFQRSPLIRLGSRHLSWHMDRAPNDRTLLLSFPNKAGLAYAAAFSLSGTRPGLLLADGREIPLIFDALTFQCLRGGIPGVLTGTVGLLDTAGQARVLVHTNALGAALKGLRAWAAAIVIDPKAPSGISHIVGPTLLEIRQ